MNIKKLITECINEVLEEDYPSSWNKEEFKKVKSFRGKLNYAVTHLTKIASGSGRAVFKIDDSKVLKIAKNKRGLAQNAVESEAYIQNYDIVTRTYDKDQNDFWVEAELARKLTPTRFKQLTGVSLDDTDKFIRHEYLKHTGHKQPFFKMDNIEDIRNNEFLIDVISLMFDYDMPSGDLGRISSYGEVIRDGKPKVVLCDYGLTSSVYNDFYKVH